MERDCHGGFRQPYGAADGPPSPGGWHRRTKKSRTRRRTNPALGANLAIRRSIHDRRTVRAASALAPAALGCVTLGHEQDSKRPDRNHGALGTRHRAIGPAGGGSGAFSGGGSARRRLVAVGGRPSDGSGFSRVLLADLWRTFQAAIHRTPGRHLERRRITIDVLDDINKQIQRFLLVRAVTSAIVGVATWAALAVMDVRQAAVWGILAGVFNSIPYFGPVIVSGGLLVV